MKCWQSTVRHVALVIGLASALLVGLLAGGPETAAAGALPKASEAAAAQATKSGRIALMTATGGDILLLDPATGKLQRLTVGMDPAFSPDGTKLTFTRWTPESGVYVRDMKTGAERKVIGADKPRSPTWSSDGQKLAFVRVTGSIRCLESVLGCLPEDQLRAMFGGGDCAPTTTIKLCISRMPVRYIDQMGIVVVGLDGAGWQDIPAFYDAQSVAWRPNSEDLLHRANGRLQMTGPNRTPYDVTTDTGYGSPAWSPDGAKFVAQKRIHDHTDLALMDGSGALLKYLTRPPSALRRSPHNVAPAWSPDGKTILFLTDREAEGVWKLYSMNADGSGQAPFLPQALKGVTFKYDFAAERVVSWGK